MHAYPTVETTLWFGGVVLAITICVWFGIKIPARFLVTRRMVFTVAAFILAVGLLSDPRHPIERIILLVCCPLLPVLYLLLYEIEK